MKDEEAKAKRPSERAFNRIRKVLKGIDRKAATKEKRAEIHLQIEKILDEEEL
jgi:hypothetical protein